LQNQVHIVIDSLFLCELADVITHMVKKFQSSRKKEKYGITFA